MGINLNFGPVVDLNLNPDNPIIAESIRLYQQEVEMALK